VHRLDGVVQRYAWGSTTAIPRLLGHEPDGEPQAELWLGDHPGGPASVGGLPLPDLIALDPVGALGVDVLDRFGARLPFLLKYLAAAAPLSLQAHPSAQRAAAGFADEAADGVPLDAPHRRYRDPNHKPELLCALTPFWALCGIRPLDEVRALLRRWRLDDLRAFAPLADGDVALALRALLTLREERHAGERAELVARVAAGAADDDGPEATWSRRIAEAHPGDSGVGVALLLNLVQLAPGEAVYLGAGNLHAYLEGVGVELMAASDNVLRGGLTTKHVDVDELLAVVDPTPSEPPVVRAAGTGRVHRYETQASEFELIVVDATADPVAVAAEGPRIVLALEGSVALTSALGTTLDLPQGEAAWVPASDGALALAGDGRAALAHVPT
jgi:mannose-6-phosphate isomerase